MEFLAVLLPVIIDFINRRFANSSDARLFISILVCGIFGTFINWVNTQFLFTTPLDAFNSISASIMIAFGLAQLSFKAVWEKTEIHKEIKGITLE
jgi:hypothetical protein